jgi:hypothetical protein
MAEILPTFEMRARHRAAHTRSNGPGSWSICCCRSCSMVCIWSQEEEAGWIRTLSLFWVSRRYRRVQVTELGLLRKLVHDLKVVRQQAQKDVEKAGDTVRLHCAATLDGPSWVVASAVSPRTCSAVLYHMVDKKAGVAGARVCHLYIVVRHSHDKAVGCNQPATHLYSRCQ